MNPFLALVIASLLSRISYQMARSPVLPRFAQDLGATPELIGRVGYDRSFDVLAAIILAFLTIFLFSVRDPAVTRVPPTPR